MILDSYAMKRDITWCEPLSCKIGQWWDFMYSLRVQWNQICWWYSGWGNVFHVLLFRFSKAYNRSDHFLFL